MQERIQAAIDYIEAHLTEEIDVHDVAARAYVSAFHLQRMFTALCGMPLGEYIRRRRLTQAAQELLRGSKVIEAAVKYGYDSPDSFARAFRRFHGVLPSHAGHPGVTLQAFAPLKINLKESGNMMEYKIVEKAAFTVAGYKKQFNNETSYQEIPKWWDEMMAQGMPLNGEFGVCIDTACTLGMCAERNAIANMITHGESEIEKVVAVMSDGSVGSPCGACREFMMQLDKNSGDIEILTDLESGSSIKLKELVPDWWGTRRFT